jgi:hypothetical protein
MGHDFRLRPLIAALILASLGLGGVELHAEGANHQVVSRGERFVAADCDGAEGRHLDSARVQRQDPCTACVRSLQQRGLDGASPHAVSAPEPRLAAWSFAPRILGLTDRTPIRGRAPPLS